MALTTLPPGACTNHPYPWLWDGDNHPTDNAEATRICVTQCPIRVECRALAHANGEEHGIWGGINLNPPKRRLSRTDSHRAEVAA